MSNAAVQVINWNIPVDIKIIKDQYYQEEEHQKLWNELYGKVLKVKKGVRNTDSLSVYPTGPSDNRTAVYSN